jgi:hypothetical protein
MKMGEGREHAPETNTLALKSRLPQQSMCSKYSSHTTRKQIYIVLCQGLDATRAWTSFYPFLSCRRFIGIGIGVVADESTSNTAPQSAFGRFDIGYGKIPSITLFEVGGMV